MQNHQVPVLRLRRNILLTVDIVLQHNIYFLCYIMIIYEFMTPP